MRWLSFLQQAMTVTATAAAGSAATVATTNPVPGAAASAAAKRSTEQLLTEFLPAQQQALDTLLERTRSMELLLGSIQSDLQALLDAPWRTALLHIADATKHPARAQAELQIARNSLYEAMGSATASAKRALIAQQLAVVYGLLGESQDSRDWLHRSLQEANRAGREEVETVIESVASLPRMKARVKGRFPSNAKVPVGTLAVFEGTYSLSKEPKLTFCVPEQPLASALSALAETRLDFSRLQVACGPGDVEIGVQPMAWSVKGAAAAGRAPEVELSVVRDGGYTICSSAEAPMRASVLLNSLVRWAFVMDGAPLIPPAKLFVSGSSPELGGWREELAVSLHCLTGEKTWRANVPVIEGGHSDPVQYKYFFVPDPGAAPVWEPGENRDLSTRVIPELALGRFRYMNDTWRS